MQKRAFLLQGKRPIVEDCFSIITPIINVIFEFKVKALNEKNTFVLFYFYVSKDYSKTLKFTEVIFYRVVLFESVQ